MLKPALRTLDTRTAKPSPKRADPELLTPEHRAWRAEVLRRAGYRCEWIEDGRRCPVAAPKRLIADHVRERKDGGAPLDSLNGQCLCTRHNTLKGLRARDARMQERF
jgi:hypothetical protein